MDWFGKHKFAIIATVIACMYLVICMLSLSGVLHGTAAMLAYSSYQSCVTAAMAWMVIERS